MDLIKLTKNILKTRESKTSKEEYENLKSVMEKQLRNTNSLETIKRTFQLDEQDVLPFDAKKALFEKLISLEKNKENLENFAWWLQLNGGPDWDELANELLIEAKECSI